jgi:hypothetical protein
MDRQEYLRMLHKVGDLNANQQAIPGHILYTTFLS